MTALPLDRVLVSGRDLETVVAVRDGTPLRFGRFVADVMHTARAVQARGVARGALRSADPYRFLVGLFGLMHAGAMVVLPPDGLPGTLVSLRDEFDVLLCDEPPPPDLEALPIEEGQPGGPPAGALDPAVAMLTFFTSGSTGTPKRIVKPLTALNHEIAVLDAGWALAAAGRIVMATVPYRHIYGLTYQLLWPLAAGLPFASHVDEFWETLLARDVTDAVLITSPAHLTRLSGIAPLPAGRAPALVFTGGAPLLAAQAREAARVLGLPLTEMFGSTEVGAIATRIQRAQGADEPWTPLPGIQVRPDEGGCMLVYSPLSENGAPFASADRIELTLDGRFHFLGRADRIVKFEGKRVSLTRLEVELVALFLVDDAAAVILDGTPERLAVAIVLTGEGRVRLDSLGAFRFSRDLRRQLSRVFESASLPKSWRFVDSLPQGALGKRREADIRALFEPGASPER